MVPMYLLSYTDCTLLLFGALRLSICCKPPYALAALTVKQGKSLSSQEHQHLDLREPRRAVGKRSLLQETVGRKPVYEDDSNRLDADNGSRHLSPALP